MNSRMSLVFAIAMAGCGGWEGMSNSDKTPSVPDCADCTLAFTPAASIGDTSNSGVVPDWPVFAFNGDQTLLVSEERNAIHQFDLHGERITSHGSVGDGPGELRGVDGIMWSSPTSFVVHRSDGRLVEFNENGPGVDRPRIEPGCALESMTLPIVCVGEGGVDVRSPSVRVLGIAGDLRSEFTPKPGRVRDGRCVMCRALVASAGDRQLWAASRRFHLVELWDRDGQVMVSTDLTTALEKIVLDSIGMDVPGRLRTLGIIPLTSIGALGVVDGFIRQEDQIRTPVIAEVNGVRVESEAMTKLMQVRPLGTIISIVDTVGNLLASQFFRGRTFLDAGGEFVAELRETSEGTPALVLGELAVIEQE